MAWDLLRFATNRLHRVVVRVAEPAFCRMKDDNQRLSDAYLTLVDSCSRGILPFVACVAVAAPEILGTVYGPQWISAAVPLRLLAPGLALFGVRLAVGPIYYSKDRPSFDLWLSGMRFLLIVVTLSIFVLHGLASASVAMSGVEGAITVVGQLMVCSLIGMSFVSLVAATIPGFELAMSCGLATFGGKALVEFAGINGWSGLFATMLPAIVVIVYSQTGRLRQLLLARG